MCAERVSLSKAHSLSLQIVQSLCLCVLSSHLASGGQSHTSNCVSSTTKRLTVLLAVYAVENDAEMALGVANEKSES